MTTSTHSGRTEAPLERTSPSRATIFAALWAVALLAHAVLSFEFVPIPDDNPLETAVALAVVATAVALLLRPSRSWLLVAAGSVQVVHLLISMPRVPDSWLLVGMINVVIVATAVGQWLQHRTLDGRKLHLAFSPQVRVVTIVTYAVSALSKYNTAFFDPDVSCAVVLAEKHRELLAFLPSPPGVIPIVIAVAAETLIPILLVIPRMRRIGVVVAVVFHASLAITPLVAVMNYTAPLIALWFLFTPRGAAERMVGLRRRLGAVLGRWREPVRTLALVLPVVVGLLILTNPSRDGGAHLLAYFALSSIYLTAAIVAAFAVLRVPHTPLVGARDGVARRTGAVVIALALVSSAGPYVGLKAAPAFTMFSNLSTEGGVSNSVLLPSTDVLGDTELVEIEQSDHPWLATDDAAVSYPLAGLRLAAAHDPDASITYIYRGRSVTADEMGDDPLIGGTPPAWQRYLRTFRAVTTDGPQECRN